MDRAFEIVLNKENNVLMAIGLGVKHYFKETNSCHRDGYSSKEYKSGGRTWGLAVE